MNIYSSPDYAAVAGSPCVCESVGSERAYALIHSQRIVESNGNNGCYGRRGRGCDGGCRRQRCCCCRCCRCQSCC